MKKGNLIIGQSGGPTSVINSSLAGIVETCLQNEDFAHVYGMRFGIEGFLEESFIDFHRVSASVIKRLKGTPGSALGSCRKKLKKEELPDVKEILKKYDIHYFFLIGGNDTMDTIYRVEKYCKEVNYELTCLGIPKTVDNDLYGTDHTPGFPSAARYIAVSVQQAGRLAADMQKVDKYVIFQTIGRDSGWLAAAGVLAKNRPEDAPHLIYMPERPLNHDKVLKDVTETIKNIGWCSIVIGEGTLWEDGTPVSAGSARDNFANTEFGAMGGASAAFNLHRLINKETGYRGEFQITESLPMCAIDRASETDLKEAYTCGRTAVEYALQEISGVMISINRLSSEPYRVKYGKFPLAEAAGKAKPLPDNFISSGGNFMTEEFLTYIRPLVGRLDRYSILL